ncbi:MAG: Hpt domain-containing protein [Prolixibacteraceae bacterium]|nr:Hpt domain-containing protein [Prolixibacteraceae bacterium]MBN2775264.1 Hpt domain-containing protein [Prolixibacteraceae bacterium]
MTELKITDLSYLKQVSGGEPKFMKEMIRIFSEQVPEFISNMEQHLADKNYIELGREAHKAKSSVIIVGMNEMGSKMKELQLLTEKNEGIERYPDFVNEFKSLCLAAVDELNAYSDEL